MTTLNKNPYMFYMETVGLVVYICHRHIIGHDATLIQYPDFADLPSSQTNKLRTHMLIRFKTFNCGTGDCLFIILQNKERFFHVMVDCGRLTDEILSYVTHDLNKTINMLIVTHIDNDHINGIASLLHRVHDLEIGRIIFNCYHRVKNEGIGHLTTEQRNILSNLKQRCPAAAEVIDGKVSAKAAISLSEQILNNPEWAKVWDTSQFVAGNTIELDGGYGRIRLLSPLANDLHKLEKQFKKEFWAQFYKEYTVPISEDEVIYEVLLRIWELSQTMKSASKASHVTLGKESFARAADKETLSMSLTNQCSLAFVYEYENLRFLLMGDADPKIVTDSLKEAYPNQMPIQMDLVKVSHHGSSHSTTKELSGNVKSSHYYFTGGNRDDRPSLEAVSRIVANYGQEEKPVCTLHFNRSNQFVKELEEYSKRKECRFVVDLKNTMYEAEI